MNSISPEADFITSYEDAGYQKADLAKVHQSTSYIRLSHGFFNR
jgi:hypothetical protein